MISFRYHLVTIVAVFLALGIGVVVGTTVIDQGLVDRLERQTQDANAAAGRARDRADGLDATLRRTQDFAAEVVDKSVQGRLADEPFVILTDDGTDGPTVKGVIDDLEAAGGKVQAVISTTPRLAAEDDGSREDLAGILGMPADTPRDRLQATVGQRLGDRLATGSRGADDLLFDLMKAGFLAGGSGPGLRQPDGATLPEIGGPGQSVVVVSGGGPQPLVAPDGFLVPTIASAVPAGAEVAAVEPSEVRLSLVEAVRDSVRGQYLTVDNIDDAVGKLSLVLGLQDLLGAGDGAAYGFKAGADAPYPPLGT